MTYLLAQTETLGFYYLFDYKDAQLKLEKLLDQLLSCDYFADSWRETVINLIDWIDIWNHTIDPHFSPKLFKKTVDSSYEIKDMYAGNSSNPPNSVIMIKHRNGNEYSVVQGGSLSKCNYQFSKKIVCIQDCYGYIIAKRIKEFFANLNLWMEESGHEIILDPHYYLIN